MARDARGVGSPYQPTTLEEKWRTYWKAHPPQIDPDGSAPKYYCLDMFPYPSGEGLHVGHWRGYTLSDVWSRYKTLQGYRVLHPMGWDAFGLPAENHAIRTGIHPAISTLANSAHFKQQLEETGAVYDWTREFSTSDPAFYQWTQYFFLQMFKRGLAYRREMPVNWCPECQTGLANEEVVGGVCDRCGAPTTLRNMEQWMLRITAYADELLTGLDQLDWPDKVKRMQRAWIGRRVGAEIHFVVADARDNPTVTVFSTRPDTLFGATFLVLAPEHPLVDRVTRASERARVTAYVHQTRQKSARTRQIEAGQQTKTGVFTGAHALHPLSGKSLPIWIADYVLMDYGTGAIMAVPAHDERDFHFAKTFSLPIVPVVTDDGRASEGDPAVNTRPGILVNSQTFDGLRSDQAAAAITAELARLHKGASHVTYRMRDWVFSRQRYWGEPIPILHCDLCGLVPVPEEDLPVVLPDVERYRPTGTGASPLAAIPQFVNTTCPACGGPARRETDTMPQWAGSSWYFLRYADPHNTQEPFSRTAVNRWLPVDMYVGGVEHAVLHLLYARFVTKVIRDLGLIDFDEPFLALFNQGMVLKDGTKMSKSKGNAVAPEPLVRQYGTDALRVYELFMGPPEDDAEWNPRGLVGVSRFLTKVWNLVTGEVDRLVPARTTLTQHRHRLVATVTERLEGFRFNTVVSALMEYVNVLSIEAARGLDRESLETLVVVLAPLAPHLAEELHERLGHGSSVMQESWPTFDPRWLTNRTITLAVLVNGRVRGHLSVSPGASESEVMPLARDLAEPWIPPGAAVRTIYVPDRLVNLAVGLP